MTAGRKNGRTRRTRCGAPLVVPFVVVGIALSFGVVVFHPAPGAAQAAPSGSTAPLDIGRMVFQRDCAVCHGADATGTTYGPSLQGVGLAAVDYWVTTGRMPLLTPARPAKSPENQSPPGQRLPDPSAQPRGGPALYPPSVISDLEDYVATIAPGGPGIPQVNLSGTNLANGGELYRLQCAACHEWAGVGGALYQREAPGITGATPTQVAEAIITGPGQMPKFGPPAVPAGQLNDVVAYVHYLRHPQDPGGNPLWYLGPVAEGGVAILLGLGALLLIVRWIGDRS
ncbi:MAG TPA: c-type cytochrome [Acidimicrobiales bacterium]|nr:c-type cytochrome [Acidimicrobiales bacterium]